MGVRPAASNELCTMTIDEKYDGLGTVHIAMGNVQGAVSPKFITVSVTFVN